MISNKTIIRVRYADTDKMQFVYNGKYFEYFEVARTELLRSAGLPYADIEKKGYQLPLIKAGIEFKEPAFYDDLLEVEATVSELISAKVHIEYCVRKKDTAAVLATGFTDHVFINVNSKKAVRPPKIYLDVLAHHFDK